MAYDKTKRFLVFKNLSILILTSQNLTIKNLKKEDYHVTVQHSAKDLFTEIIRVKKKTQDGVSWPTTYRDPILTGL